ncbi:MAG: hypothetical protein IPM17_06080 [Verrucomicrobia bacterium]|nr:hypothetical protein [Verrucomicrobiota bacterium]
MHLRVFMASLAAAVSLPVGASAAADTPANYTAVSKIHSRAEDANTWVIRGQQVEVRLDRRTLGLVAERATNVWRFAPSREGDLRVTGPQGAHSLRLASAASMEFTPYTTGYSAGVKVVLSGYAEAGDLTLTVLVTLDGPDEDLLCELLASDGAHRIRELQWPGAVTGGSFDATVVPFMQGMLLPQQWPEKTWLYDTLSFGRGLYMPWWGHLQGDAGLLTILETPDDAGCDFDHPAGGPTRLGPRWVSSLGRWAYPRRARFCLLPAGGYVAMAKRYRQHAIAGGRFVSLQEKIARNPRVGELVGTPVIHTSILYHIQPDSSYYSKDNPAQNHQLVTFDARRAEVERLASNGVRRAYLHLDGWGFRGYDNLHPDVLPPSPEAGGWSGMKRFADTCDRLGFVFAIHDQYRDYYLDAASYDERHAVRDEAGHFQTHATWYGGQQTLLCSRFAPGHVRRNHQTILAQGVKLRGAYLDVFSVVPPDECHAPEHPVTRRECLRFRGATLDAVRSWGGVVSSEEPSDWSIPHLDLVHHGPYALNPNPGKGPAMGIPVPLFNLVYHDALLTPWSLERGAWGIPEKDLGFLHGLANAGLPYLSLTPGPDERERVRILCALHRRVGLLELTEHRFLDQSRRRQEFRYADGTAVKIDLATDAYDITPPLRAEELAAAPL